MPTLLSGCRSSKYISWEISGENEACLFIGTGRAEIIRNRRVKKASSFIGPVPSRGRFLSRKEIWKKMTV